MDDEDCWDMNYTGPTTEIRDQIESILHSWGGGSQKSNRLRGNNRNQREKGSLFHTHLRDPETVINRNLQNEDIFEIIRNPPEVGAVRISEKPEFWDTTTGLIKAVTTQGIATIQLPSGPTSLDGAQWYLMQVPTHLGPTYNTN